LRVLAIFGPTAVGKTGVAIEVAEQLKESGEDPVAVNCDSIQVYRGLETLSGAACDEERQRLEHRLVSFIEPGEEFSAGRYAEAAHAEIDSLLSEGRRPIVVGGTGLYLRAALADMDLPPPPAPGSRERFEALYDELGADRAHELLAERDAAAAAVVHANDRKRVVRALELAEAGSSLLPVANRLWGAETRHPTLVVGLDVPPEVLAERIERRTREMFERGVEDEVRAALSSPLSQTALTIHGLGDVAGLPREQAVEAVIARTRRYAAYQRKWMRRIPELVLVDANRAADEIAEDVVTELGSVARA
jgi:tRNA dimethylallyltransferase